MAGARNSPKGRKAIALGALPNCSGQEIGTERRKRRQFDQGEQGGETEPGAGCGRQLDIAEPKPLAAAPPPVAGHQPQHGDRQGPGGGL